MPIAAADHKGQDIIEISSFMGGMNKGVPATQLQDDECELIENFFFDRRSNKPRTRYPIVKYSNSAVDPVAPIDSLYYWDSTWFVASAQKLYYLDSSLDPVSLGTLNGSTRPVFVPYNNKLIVFSGGAPQYTDTTPSALTDVGGDAPSNASYGLQMFSRIVATGDSGNVDRVYESAYTDETDWSVGAADYADVGYLDGTSVVGITEAFEGLYIVFKRGDNGLRTYYLTALSETNPQAKLISDNHAPISHAAVAHAQGIILLMEENYISALAGTDAQGKIIYDSTPGLKLASTFQATTSGFACTYPRDSQVWFVPDPLRNEAYIFHYHIGAWTKFSFVNRKIYSAFYEASGDYLYLGADDGFIYKYDRATTTYQDTSGNYPQKFHTKIFTGGTRELNIKAPRLYWSDLKSGAGNFRLKDSYGTSTKINESITVADAELEVYDTQVGQSNPTYVYDTQVGGTSEMEVWPDEASYNSHKADYNASLDNVQFEVYISSGALMIERIVAETAEGRRT
jgi:hypothetical protein